MAILLVSVISISSCIPFIRHLEILFIFIFRTFHEERKTFSKYANSTNNNTHGNIHNRPGSLSYGYFPPNETSTLWSMNFFILIYSILVAILLILATVRSFFYYFIASRSSKRLHDKAFDRLLHTNMRFFETNPSGNFLKINFLNLFTVFFCI